MAHANLGCSFLNFEKLLLKTLKSINLIKKSSLKIGNIEIIIRLLLEEFHRFTTF